MQSACVIENVEKKTVDEEEDVDFHTLDWLTSPTEKPLRATIVEWRGQSAVIDGENIRTVPNGKTMIHVKLSTYAPSKKDEWIFLARLIHAYDYWLGEVRKKHPKELRRAYVAAEAKERLRIIGACLLDFCRQHKLLPLDSLSRSYAKRQAASAEKKDVVKPKQLERRPGVWAARRRTPRLSAQELRTWEPATLEDYQERAELETSKIPWCSPPQVGHVGLCAIFADLMSRVKAGERTQVSYGNYKEIVRSNDGNTIVVTDKSGLQKTLTRGVMERDGWSVTTVEAKYSRPVRFTARNGTVTYNDTEREMTFRPIAADVNVTEYAHSSKPVKAVSDLLSNIAPTTTLLTETEERRQARLGREVDPPTAPTVPNGIRVRAGENTYEPNSCLGVLTPSAWRSILHHKVRMNQDGKTFTIRGKTYRIVQFRVHARKVGDKYETTTLDVTKYTGMRGQLAWPYLAAVANKLAYLQRVSPETSTFDNVLEKRLPWLLSNIDMLVDETAAQTAPELAAKPLCQ